MNVHFLLIRRRMILFLGVPLLLFMMACSSNEKKELSVFYRVRRCYDSECDKLKRFGPTLSITKKYRPGKLCFKEQCELLEEYGPNGMPILEQLKEELKKKQGLVNILKEH
ncbi:MAG: hypothetical protein HQM13_10075 [SAR324 cluster bacterium]|nr:hypothetical protein [SAR324 cluster bacterium]